MRYGGALASFLAAGASLLAAAVVCAQTAALDPAQACPNKSIRFIAPYPAGGTSDILGCFIGQKMTE